MGNKQFKAEPLPGEKVKEIFLKLFKKIPSYFFPVIASLISGSALILYLDLTTTNAFSLVFLFLLYPIFRKSLQIKKVKLKVTAYLISLFYTLAMLLLRFEEMTEKEHYVLWFIIVGVGLLLMFAGIISCAYNRLAGTDLRIKMPEKRRIKGWKVALVFGCSMLIMLLGWLPYFLLHFPGNVTTDSNWQLLQATGQVSLSNHHPIACTMMIKLFYGLGLRLFNGNQTLAIATYSVCQAILLSAAFSYLISTLYRFKVKIPVLIAILAFYTLIPYNAVYSVTMWKDVWFAGIILVLSTTIFRLVKSSAEKTERIPIFEFVMFFIFGIAMCLFRSNGFYAFLVLVPFVFFGLIKKNPAVPILAVLVVPLSLLIKGPIYGSMGVQPPDTIESLSIPAQHIAKAIKDGAELTYEQRDLLSAVVDIDRIPEVYNPNISDPIKDLVRFTDNQRFIEKHKSEFLKLWIDLGLKNPRSYIIAQVDQTYGYWYPDVQYWVYPAEFINSNFEFEKDMKVSEQFGKVLTYISNSYMTIPYWGVLWSVGTMTWATLFMFGFCIVKKKGAYISVYIPVLGVIATLLIATPVFAEFRYAYSVFVTLPLLCVLPLIGSGVLPSKKVHAEAVSVSCASEESGTATENGLLEADIIADPDSEQADKNCQAKDASTVIPESGVKAEDSDGEAAAEKKE